MKLRLKASVADLEEIAKIQCSDGNWNYDPYMHGLANGIILSLHTVQDLEGEPPFLDAPKQWLESKKVARPFSNEENKLLQRFKQGHMASFLRLYKDKIVKRRVPYSRLSTPCWEWAGWTDKDGYARITFEGKKWQVYRLVWTFINGPIPEGMEVDHLCQTRNCFNPEHLQLATPEYNKQLIKQRRDESLGQIANVHVCTEQNIQEWTPQDLEKVVWDSHGEHDWFKLVRVVGSHREQRGNVYEFYALRKSPFSRPNQPDLYDVVAYMVDFFSEGTLGIPFADGPVAKEEMVTELEGTQYILTTNH